MTSKERGQFIRLLLKYLTKRTENIIRMYFGIDSDRSSLKEISDEFECSTRTIRDYLNKGLNMIRVFITHSDTVFPSERMVEERKICKQLKEYVEGINPDLINKELPYYYSKYLDEFMLCLIDGVENTTSRSSKQYKTHMILREFHDMSLEERGTISIYDYRSKRLREMGDGMYRKV
jgi:predicted DNA-binding protein YlxM (UPF0122 family)